jgi:hypothetical protein
MIWDEHSFLNNETHEFNAWLELKGCATLDTSFDSFGDWLKRPAESHYFVTFSYDGIVCGTTAMISGLVWYSASAMAVR